MWCVVCVCVAAIPHAVAVAACITADKLLPLLLLPFLVWWRLMVVGVMMDANVICNSVFALRGC
jgi:hypothetical protein